MVICLETTNEALVIWLYVHGEIRLEVLNLNVGEGIRNNMPREIVL